MEVSRAGDSGDQEEHADSAVQSQADDLEQDRLTNGTQKGEAIAYKVELGDLCSSTFSKFDRSGETGPSSLAAWEAQRKTNLGRLR